MRIKNIQSVTNEKINFSLPTLDLLDTRAPKDTILTMTLVSTTGLKFTCVISIIPTAQCDLHPPFIVRRKMTLHAEYRAKTSVIKPG